MYSKPVDCPISIYLDGDVLQFTIPNLIDLDWFERPIYVEDNPFNVFNIMFYFGLPFFIIVACIGGWVVLVIVIFLTVVIATFLIKRNKRICHDARCEIISINRASKKMTVQKKYQVDRKRNEYLPYANPICKIVLNPPGRRISRTGKQEQISWGASILTIYTSIENQLIFPQYSISCIGGYLNKHLSKDDLYWMAEVISNFLSLELEIGTQTKSPITADEWQNYLEMT
jgi:hypothetical protein